MCLDFSTVSVRNVRSSLEALETNALMRATPPLEAPAPMIGCRRTFVVAWWWWVVASGGPFAVRAYAPLFLTPFVAIFANSDLRWLQQAEPPVSDVLFSRRPKHLAGLTLWGLSGQESMPRAG